MANRWDRPGRPVVSWRENVSGSYEVYVRRLEGNTWEEIDGSASGHSFSGDSCCTDLHAITTDAQGRPVVAYEEHDSNSRAQIFVVRLESDRWTHLGSSPLTGGGVSNTIIPSENPNIALDGNGDLVVVWKERRGLVSREVFARRFDGKDWVELAPGSASGGGVSNSAAASYDPKVAADATRTCITWSEAGERSRRVLVRCVAKR